MSRVPSVSAELRRLLLPLSDSERVNALVLAGFCALCGEDLIRQDGRRALCYCAPVYDE